jgi:uncharacterized protein
MSSSLITPELVRTLRERFVLAWSGIHGVRHWDRVRENGLRLAARTGARERVVEAFAYVHDSCRISNGLDPDHGSRAGDFARQLVRGEQLLLLPDELELLVRACEGHSAGRTIDEVTICTCWDADRLDLGRVGITPRADYLCTEPARDPAFMRWAHERSVHGRH